jgi:hypothetical protein
MRISRGVSLAAGLALALSIVSPVAAQDAETLRKELEQMRKQFQETQQQYQKAIDALGERLQRLEAQPQPIVTPPMAPPASIAMQAPGGPQPPSSQPSALDLLRPRQPFGLYGARGSGQLLFDMGVAGDFVANFTQRDVDRAHAGTFAGRENRFFPREIELSLFGQIDPYARAEIRIETGEEAAKEELTVHLAEANLTLLTLPYGTQLKMGQMRNRFGLLNQIHEHDLPQTDRPNVYRIFFGEEGLVERGGELTWVPDLPFYFEGLVGVFNGDNETAFGRGKISQPLVTGRARTFFELTDTSAIQLGASVASGLTADQFRSTLVGFDVKYKYRPEGWLHPFLTLSGEGIFSSRNTKVGDDVDSPVEDRTRNRFGWYAYGELQPFRRWAFGLRYDWTQYPLEPGREWAVEPYVTFMPSEFLKFRLGYKHTGRSHALLTDSGINPRLLHEVLLQASFLLGAHPAHSF